MKLCVDDVTLEPESYISPIQGQNLRQNLSTHIRTLLLISFTLSDHASLHVVH